MVTSVIVSSRGFAILWLQARKQERGKHLMRKPLSRAFPQAAGTGLPVQVAAVCYRVRGFTLEFLLVNTSAGKWTFPKGRIDPGLSGSESAEREAFEEAGARGRIEEVHFGSYVDTKRALGHENRTKEILVAAYMFEVRSLVKPEESDRNPTWFTPHEAKRKLSERRASKYSGQLTTLVDEAVERVTSERSSSSLREVAALRRTVVQR
jgi:8-oxo-dGTP pyrophosphatase MutT (NUDIX family)